jgi:HNH endonuclease
MLQPSIANVQQAEEQLRISRTELNEWRSGHKDCLSGRGLLLSKKVERVYSTTPFQILNGMLNSLDITQYPKFQETVDVIVKDIMDSSDLKLLSEQYDDFFLVPMRGRPRSRSGSATERVQDQKNESGSSSNKSNGFKANVRNREDNKCALTNESDIRSSGKTWNGHQVAHFIPQSLLNERKDSSNTNERKILARSFILQLCPWLANDFFENIDVCENAMLLNSNAHICFGAFEWFVTMETGPDGNTIYRAMEIEETGLLKERYSDIC